MTVSKMSEIHATLRDIVEGSAHVPTVAELVAARDYLTHVIDEMVPPRYSAKVYSSAGWGVWDDDRDDWVLTWRVVDEETARNAARRLNLIDE